MFRVIEISESHGDDLNGDSPIRIQVNSSGNSVRDDASTSYHTGPFWTQFNALLSMPPVQSIFARSRTGYALSTANFKPPQFNNDPYKYTDFKNKLHHYLLMLGIYSAH